MSTAICVGASAITRTVDSTKVYVSTRIVKPRAKRPRAPRVPIDAKQLGRNIARARLNAGFPNASKFARAIGVGVTTYNGWEKGRYAAMRLDNLLAIAIKAKTSIDDILQAVASDYPSARAESAHTDDSSTRSTDLTSPVTGVGVHSESHSTAMSDSPNQGRFVHVGSGQPGDPSRSPAPLPDDNQIIREFDGFSTLLQRIVSAYNRGEISSARLRHAGRVAVSERKHRVSVRPRKKKKP